MVKIKRIIKIKKFKTRIFFWITSIMIISTIIFSTVIYLNVENTVLGNEYESSLKILNQMKFNIEFLDEMVKNICLSTYYNEDGRALMNFIGEETYDQMSIINKFSNSIVASNPYIQSIYIYNNRKKVYYSTYNSFKYEDPDLIKLIQSNVDIPVLKPVFRRTETYHSGDMIKYSNVLTYFMYELKDNQNNMQGAVIINIKLDWLIDNIKIINMVNNKRQDEIFILDKNGEFIQDSINLSTENVEFEKYIKGLYSSRATDEKAQDAALLTGRLGNRNYFISYIPIEEVNWVMYKVQPYDMVFDYILKLKYTVIVITLIVLVLIFIAAYTLSKGLYKPFEGLLRLVGFSNETTSGVKSDGDEFSYLRAVYTNSIDQLEKFNLEKRSNEKIIKTYFLRKLLLQSSSITCEEFDINKLENGISLTLDEPFIVILLAIDRHKEFEEKNDVATRELLKFAIVNITTEILSGSFLNETVEMKNDEIAIIINTGKVSSGIYEQLSLLLKEAQRNVMEYYNISFTAVLSEETDKVNKLTPLYTQVVNYSMYRFIFGLMSVITPDMLTKNLAVVQHDYNYEKHDRLIEEIKRGNLRAAEGVLINLLEDIRKLEYNNIMLSLAHLVNRIRNTVYDINQTRKAPINVNMILATLEIFQLETIDEFSDILMEVLQKVIIQDKTPIDNRELHIAETVQKIISENYSDYDLSVSSIAERLRMSPAKIGKICKENLNMSILEYINNVRLAKAVEWMENSKLSISEIILKVGIENESYFYKIFKIKYGATPREYITRDVHK